MKIKQLQDKKSPLPREISNGTIKKGVTKPIIQIDNIGLVYHTFSRLSSD